jgi:hypothetical protein
VVQASGLARSEAGRPVELAATTRPSPVVVSELHRERVRPLREQRRQGRPPHRTVRTRRRRTLLTNQPLHERPARKRLPSNRRLRKQQDPRNSISGTHRSKLTREGSGVIPEHWGRRVLRPCGRSQRRAGGLDRALALRYWVATISEPDLRSRNADNDLSRLRPSTSRSGCCISGRTGLASPHTHKKTRRRRAELLPG